MQPDGVGQIEWAKSVPIRPFPNQGKDVCQMFCSNCGTQLLDGDIFCRRCGRARQSQETEAHGDTAQLERKVIVLEQQVQTLREQFDALDNRIPRTALLSHRLLTRAFAVWGHLLAAQVVVYAVVITPIVLVAIVMLLSPHLH